MSSAELLKFSSVYPAKIEWRECLPYSLEFEDVYYSVHGAIEESTHVFINGNQLKSDWNKAEDKNRAGKNKQSHFQLMELGFGSGLNFLNTARHWQQHIKQSASANQAPNQSPKQHLHYLAIEKRPFSLKDFQQSSQLWPELKPFSDELAKNYPSITYGRHQIHFKCWNMSLTLFFMPINNALDELILESKYQPNKLKMDHWYLDGFAPSKNTSMWGLENALKIAKLSKIGCRLATYSVAGSVKQPLAHAGFEIIKQKGFAKKREMLTAILKQQPEQKKAHQHINLKYENPWFMLKNNSSSDEQQSADKSAKKVAIIGGGIAGTTCAYTLSQQGFNCDLYETNAGIAQAASGAAAGIFHPQLTKDMNITSQFSWQSYLTLLRFIGKLSQQESQKIIMVQGIHRFLKNAELTNDVVNLAQNLHIEAWVQASKLFQSQDQAIYFPHAATINMPAFCQLLLNKIPVSQLSIKTDSQVTHLNQKEQSWEVVTADSSEIYSHVIFCGGAKSNLLNNLNLTNTHTSRGQTCYFQSEKLASSIKTTIVEQHYIVPQKNNSFQLGSSFEDFIDDSLNQTTQTTMLKQLNQFLTTHQLDCLTTDEIATRDLKGTVGYRLHANDRKPIIGPAIDLAKLQHDFSNLGQKRINRQSLSHYNLPGLWINTAYGSHGLLFSLLASQHLTSMVNNTVSPLSCNISQAIHPVRFFIQELKTQSNFAK